MWLALLSDMMSLRRYEALTRRDDLHTFCAYA
jgi:hypothetical protein